MGVGGQSHAPAAIYRGKTPCTNSTVDGVGLQTGMDRCGKSRPHRDDDDNNNIAKTLGRQSIHTLFRHYLSKEL